MFFHCGLSYDVEYISLCYTVDPCFIYFFYKMFHPYIFISLITITLVQKYILTHRDHGRNSLNNLPSSVSLRFTFLSLRCQHYVSKRWVPITYMLQTSLRSGFSWGIKKLSRLRLVPVRTFSCITLAPI